MEAEFGDKDSLPAIFSTHHHHHRPPPLLAVSHHLTTTSDEADNKKEFSTTNDGASIEVVRRPRGRPPGSRNKPKPQPLVAFITQEPDSLMSPYVLEVPGGLDIIAAVTRFCNHRNTGLCVLSGCGTVSSVSFRQPTTTITFHGCFELLSISATVLSSTSPPSAVMTPFANRFAISLAGPQGQTVGGAVTGPLIAVGTVYLVAASFNNPLYHRLPMEEEKDEHIRSSNGGSVSVSGGVDGGRRHAAPSTAADSVSMYNCQPPSDVIWAPTPRQALPRSPLY
ncbi:AT-hook motif nuclear-localized protein 28-like [Cynara cardunculus var. scolymus]|uniref:PPC domain-containing protein n=1 Tax=Cynara cardunculus var. scolymus TaxID=59895 RepID=A0A118JZ95_CYNCS|nr:AT-hook motif nuclear-localized protein 28-like [Cynara cardunculus var. scolymus]KVH99697.1 hypothetical protein Ccrd_022061 [Cynara cardunculus var. scolymus]